MDIIAAYREVGSYRGAAEMCGTTHKTVRRVVRRPRPGAAAEPSAAGPQLRRGHGSGRGQGGQDVWADLGEAAAASGAGGRLRRVGAQLPAAGRRAETAVAARSSPWPPAGGVATGPDAGDRLGRRGRAARVLRGAGLVAVPVRAVRRRRAGDDHTRAARRVLRHARWSAQDGAGRPDGLPEGRAWWRTRWCPPRTTSGSPPITGSARTGARPTTRSRRASWRTWSATPNVDLLVPQAPFDDLDAANAAAAAGAPRSTPRPIRRSARSRPNGWPPSASLLGALPSLRLSTGHDRVPQGRPVVVCAVRLGPLLGADPADRRHRVGYATPTGGCW